MRRVRKIEGRTAELTRHFFRRFFENDVIQSGADTITTVVRAISIVAAPGLMFGFFLQTQYPQRPLWGRIEDEYFYVLFSFVAMASVAVFEWEMLFPDRLDFLVLGPLSLKPLQMLAAKATALGLFLGLFLVASNTFGMIVVPLLNGRPHFARLIGVHAAAVMMAGVFGAMLIAGLGGLLLCVLPARLFRTVSPLMQMLTVAALALMVIHYARFGDSMQAMLTMASGTMSPGGFSDAARWMPSFWFLGVYQRLLYGPAAPAFAAPMTRYAVWATCGAVALVLVTYPLAWVRMRRMAMEGEGGVGKQANRLATAVTHWIIRRPEERAVFHFIGQTIARNSRYQVYLAMYCGAGLALSIACATTMRVSGGYAQPGLSVFGLHAVMPLLLFWIVAGLRMAFAFPLLLQARWVFRVTGADLHPCMAAARKWAFGCGLGLLLLILLALRCAGWHGRALAVQAVCGFCLCAVLVEGFFFAQNSLPFSKPRSPGKTSLPLMLTLYVGVLPPFVFGMIVMTIRTEKDLWLLVWPLLAVPLLHYAAGALREQSVTVEEEREDGGGEIQLLGLSGDLTA
ncbi:MAG TPA: hypothetical protein VGN16_24765 [Acidobacteriaceae bacterium]|jgi:hypothetical protein